MSMIARRSANHYEILAQKIAEIRPRFLLILSERLERLEEVRDHLETAPDVLPLLEEIRSGAHRTAGLAATLGFRDLGSLSKEVDVMLYQMCHRMGHSIGQSTGQSRGKTIPHMSITPDVLDRIDSLLGEMALVLHEG